MAPWSVTEADLDLMRRVRAAFEELFGKTQAARDSAA